MGRVRLVGVTSGVVVSVALAALLLAFVSLVLDPLLISVTSAGTVDGATSTTVTGERVRGLILSTSVVLAVSFAFFVGGMLAGRLALPYSGLNGALVGTTVVVAPLVWLLGSIAFVFLEPTWNPGDVYGRSEDLRMLVAALVVYSAASPVFILASFWAGRIGGRSDRRNGEPELQSG